MYATLQDQYSNPGANRLVRWEASSSDSEDRLNIRPRQSYTNQDGLARAVVSSAVPGTFIVVVHSESSETSMDFDPITFQDDQPAV
nr:hypothetical protein [Pseudomonas sp. PB106]